MPVSLNVQQTRAILAQLVKRAIAAGYTAFVISGDRPALGQREPDVRNRYVLAPRLAKGRVFSSTGARLGPLPDGSFDLVGRVSQGFAPKSRSLISRNSTT